VDQSFNDRPAFVRSMEQLRDLVFAKLIASLVWQDDDAPGAQQRAVFKFVMRSQRVNGADLESWFSAKFPKCADSVLKKHLSNLFPLILLDGDSFRLGPLGERLRALGS